MPVAQVARLASQSSSEVTGSTKSSSSQSGNNATLNRCVPFGQAICNRLNCCLNPLIS
jgi:hypothetical protein